MRAKVAELNAQIELLGIRVEGQKVLASELFETRKNP